MSGRMYPRSIWEETPMPVRPRGTIEHPSFYPDAERRDRFDVDKALERLRKMASGGVAWTAAHEGIDAAKNAIDQTLLDFELVVRLLDSYEETLKHTREDRDAAHANHNDVMGRLDSFAKSLEYLSFNRTNKDGTLRFPVEGWGGINAITGRELLDQIREKLKELPAVDR
jgi:hypothetical protein